MLLSRPTDENTGKILWAYRSLSEYQPQQSGIDWKLVIYYS